MLGASPFNTAGHSIEGQQSLAVKISKLYLIVLDTVICETQRYMGHSYM